MKTLIPIRDGIYLSLINFVLRCCILVMLLRFILKKKKGIKENVNNIILITKRQGARIAILISILLVSIIFSIPKNLRRAKYAIKNLI